MGTEVRTIAGDRSIGWATRCAFYAWMFALPYDALTPTWLPEPFQGSLSIPRLAGIALVVAFLSDVKLRPWKLPPASRALAAFFAVFALSMLRSDFDKLTAVLQQFQNLVLLVICYNLFATVRATRGALLAYAISCGVSSILSLAGMVEVPQSQLSEGRLSAFGLNANEYSQTLLVGTLAAVGIAHIRKGRGNVHPLVLWGLVACTMAAIVNAASRGQTLALAVGLVVLVLQKGSLRIRLRNLGLLAVIGMIGFCLLSYTDTLKDRWTDTLETGSTSGRDVIAGAAIQMILEKPLTGWGAQGGYELGNRVHYRRGEERATHNMVLAMLLFTGIAGAAAYFTAYVTVLRASWWARSGVEGALPLAIFLALLIGDSISGGLPLKLHWTFFAYQLAAGMKHPPQGASHGIEVARTGSSRAGTRTAVRQRQIASSPMQNWSNSI